MAERGRSTLILVHRRPLLEQWIVQLAMFLGIAEKEIGTIGGGKRKPNGRLDVAMIQSAVRKGEVDDLVAKASSSPSLTWANPLPLLTVLDIAESRGRHLRSLERLQPPPTRTWSVAVLSKEPTDAGEYRKGSASPG